MSAVTDDSNEENEEERQRRESEEKYFGSISEEERENLTAFMRGLGESLDLSNYLKNMDFFKMYQSSIREAVKSISLSLPVIPLPQLDHSWIDTMRYPIIEEPHRSLTNMQFGYLEPKPGTWVCSSEGDVHVNYHEVSSTEGVIENLLILLSVLTSVPRDLSDEDFKEIEKIRKRIEKLSKKLVEEDDSSEE